MKLEIPKSNFITDRPVAVFMTFAAAMVFGAFSFKRLPVSLMPELTYPTITVRTEYPGAAPEEVENDISRPIEEALGVIGGLKRISSVSRAGVSDVVLEFFWGTDMSEGSQDVLEKLDLVFLPSEAERPLILHFDPSLDPIMELSFSGKGDRFEGEKGLRRLRRIAELQIKRALEPIPGVAAVRIRGGLEEEIHVLLDAETLKRTGLSIQNVIDRLAQENINVAGGSIKEGRSEYMVRTLNEFENLAEIEDTVVVRRDDRNIRVKDLGRVIRSHKELEIVTNTDGRDSVQIDIYKEADVNMVDLAKRVTERIGTIEPPKKKQSPKKDEGKGDKKRKDDLLEKNQSLARQIYTEEGAILEVVADRSTFIESSINEVKSTAVIGGILAVIILFLFLQNVKTTVIVAVSIPMSLLITFAPLNVLDVSLNIMSLGGLALGIGMLVDSSIVVLESIFRCKEEGDAVKPAAVRGTFEVRGAVFASTLTSIAVFFPMVFVKGIAGQAFGDLGLAVVFSLLASYVVAVFFIPMLASRTLPDMSGLGEKHQWHRFGSVESLAEIGKLGVIQKVLLIPILYLLLRFAIGMILELVSKICLMIYLAVLFLILKVIGPLLYIIGKVVTFLPLLATQKILNLANDLYPKTIRWSLRNPVVIIAVIALCGWATWEVSKSLETELLPEVYQGEFTFETRLPVGTPLEETQALLTGVENALLEDKTHIRTVLVTFGYDVTNTTRSDEGEHTARFKILLESNKESKINQIWNTVIGKAETRADLEKRVTDRLRRHFENIPDLEVRVKRPVLFSATTPVEVEIHGDDLKLLKDMAINVKDVMSALPELADVEASLKAGAPEIQVVYDRNRIVRYGLNLNGVARQVRDMVKGNEATRFNLKDRRIPILVRLQEDNRQRLEDIRGLTINPGGEHPIPLNAIANLTIGEGPSEVRRIDGKRVALVNANLAGGSLGAAVEAIETNLREQLEWPEDMTFFITGQNKEWNDSQESLYLALFLSLFLVYVIMASQFESLIHPFIIMFTIPLAFFGTVLGLKLLGINLSIVVFLGMIMLAGIVVNNAIVLVDYINVLKRRGLESKEAIVQAGQVRLRPILMTTATTMLGLLPMAMGFGDGAEIRTPMAIAVIFGLLTSTLLTLLVIPTIYHLLDLAAVKIFHRNLADPSDSSDQENAEQEAPA